MKRLRTDTETIKSVKELKTDIGGGNVLKVALTTLAAAETYACVHLSVEARSGDRQYRTESCGLGIACIMQPGGH